MAVARYYVADNNPEGASFPGVPLADIDEADWAQIPEHIQQSVDASSMYRKTKPRPTQDQAKPGTSHEAPSEGGSQ